MQFLKSSKFSFALAFVILMQIFLSMPVFANNAYSEIDLIRAQLNCCKDKTSKEYFKNKQKLEKLIIQNNIDYSVKARLDDVQRLISQQRYNSAIYELKDMLQNKIEMSTCNELLGDISRKNSQIKDAATYYKNAIKNDCTNISAGFKLSKLYFENKKNAMGIESLRTLVDLTNNTAMLSEIEQYIQNCIKPNDNLEANNLYEILGNIYIKTNRLDSAYRAYSRAIQLNPSDIYLKYYLADLFYQNNQTQDAIILYNLILQENPKEGQIRSTKAKSLAKEGQLLSANKEYLIVLEQYPASNQAKYGIFKIYENKLAPDKILEKINSNNPTYIVKREDILNFAKILEEMEDYSAANAFKTFADERYPLKISKVQSDEQIENQQTKVQIQKQPETKTITKKEAKSTIKKESKVQTQKQPETKTIVKKETKVQTPKEQEKPPVQPKKKVEKQSQLQPKKEIKEQEKSVIKPIEKKTDFQAKKENKQIETKKQTSEKVQKEKTKQEEIEEKAIERERQKAIAKNPQKYEEYKKVIDKYNEVSPKTAQIYCAIANTYKLMGEPTSALKNFKEALKLDAANSDINYDIGLSYLELNSVISARYYLNKAINLDKNNTKARNLLAFVNQKIITKTINDAYSEFEKKQYLEALAILETGLKSYPNNSQLYYYRALVYDAMDRNAAQIMDLEKSIELNPAYYMAYYQLGLAYEKIHDERNALVAYERFLSIEPDEKELVEEVQKKVIQLGNKYY